ncbi:MAG: excalibur calcium-binding domain-containing protein [SAR324 cluster bacterium]|nr:excalibur calcium-binding domain-containing protein [SAR324 cluster bacterium]
MTSCDEAKFYLNSCGVSSLDSDKDGTPCESLCK